MGEQLISHSFYEPAQVNSGLGYTSPLVGLLQSLTPNRLLRLLEMPHHVLTLVSLTPLGYSLDSEHRRERLCTIP